MLFLFSLEFLKEKLLLKKLLLFPTFIFFKGFVLDCLSVHSIFFLGIFFLSSLLFLTHSLYLFLPLSLSSFTTFSLRIFFLFISPYLLMFHHSCLVVTLYLSFPFSFLSYPTPIYILFSLYLFYSHSCLSSLPSPTLLHYLTSLSLSPLSLFPLFPFACLFLYLFHPHFSIQKLIHPFLSHPPPPFFLSIPFVYLIMSPLRRFVFAG
jgi:hypothetical protein